MSIPSSVISIEPVDTRYLSEDDILEIAEVTQDMWADGIGEFVQCNECHHMHSKQDIYGHLIQSQYNLTVRQIMGDFEVDNISCIQCGGETSFVYGSANINTIKQRYQNTVASFLVIARDVETGKMVGYEDAYVDSLENIYNREYKTHYLNIGIPEIRNRILAVLEYLPDNFLNLSDIGFLSPYRNIKHLSDLLHKFSQIIPKEYDNSIGFTEVDINNPISSISRAVGGISLGIHTNPMLKNKISNTGGSYKSDLLIYKDMGLTYKRNFNGSVRSLIHMIRSYSN